MIRALHRWPGLLALALITVLTLSGAALSVFPAAERLTAPQAAMGLTVGALAERIQAVYPGVEQMRRAPVLATSASVTVVARSCAEADAWATACMVKGSLEGGELARRTK